VQPTGLIVTAWHLEGLEVDWPTEMLVYDRAAPRRARRSPSHSDGGHFVWRERDRAWSVDNLKPAGPAVRGARRNEPTCTAELQQRWRLFQRLLVRNERRSWPGASPREMTRSAHFDGTSSLGMRRSWCSHIVRQNNTTGRPRALRGSWAMYFASCKCRRSWAGYCG